MLKVEGRLMIRELSRKGMSISDIARETGHDRKTIRRVLEGPSNPSPRKRKAKARKLDRFVPYLEKRIAGGRPQLQQAVR